MDLKSLFSEQISKAKPITEKYLAEMRADPEATNIAKLNPQVGDYLLMYLQSYSPTCAFEFKLCFDRNLADMEAEFEVDECDLFAATVPGTDIPIPVLRRRERIEEDAIGYTVFAPQLEHGASITDSMMSSTFKSGCYDGKDRHDWEVGDIILIFVEEIHPEGEVTADNPIDHTIRMTSHRLIPTVLTHLEYVCMRGDNPVLRRRK